MKLTIDQIAQHLNIPASKLDRWIRQGRIPIRKTGLECTFHETTLRRWAREHNLAFAAPEEAPPENGSLKTETLVGAMRRGGVVYALEGTDVESVLHEGSRHIPGIAALGEAELFQGLIERERLSSTGIGKGVAVPHPRTPLAGTLSAPIITTCFLAQPIDFGSVDDRPVFVLFFLLAPSVEHHLHLLSKLSYCVRENAFIEFLRTGPQPEALFAMTEEFETRIDN